MTELSRAVDIAGKWLDIEGVDMIIPRPDKNEIAVIITCHPDSLKHLIPSTVNGIGVIVRHEKFSAA